MAVACLQHMNCSPPFIGRVALSQGSNGLAAVRLNFDLLSPRCCIQKSSLVVLVSSSEIHVDVYSTVGV